MTLLSTVALGLVVSGCNAASPAIAPSGVDELVVPVSEPDPAHYVDVVDNPWVGPADARGPVIDGVATTEVVSGGAVDYYAQDDRGNVWWFGRENVWQVGEPGVEAGLVITATPRLGDGYVSATYPRPGGETTEVDLVAEVVDIDAAVDVDGTTYEGCVVIDVRNVATGLVERSAYAEGVGRVQTEVQLP